MGEVYKARDTRLERTVAVKVLPPHLSSSPEGRQRFEREAKTISQFSHPHICALHDVGREGETEYLVMEYLEGETLSDRLAKGPLALDQTLRYGVEIADALDKAHRQGIVHRDLKPGNVMLTKSGVKLLDFGLAKAIEPASAPNSQTALPTQANLTQEGTILGTFQYMAPEQLEGKEADARTDIFALGAVLYEMATGKKAFPAASQASLITAIMSSEPAPISAVQPTSPAALDRIVRTCLAKDPEDRWQSAHDIGSELKWIREGSGAAAAVSGPRPVKRERLAWAVAALAVLAAAGAVYGSRRLAPAPEPVVLTLPAPPGLRFDQGATLSPDGRAVVFLASGRGEDLIWVRRLDEPQARPLEGTDSARYPFWSPDGRSIGFFQRTKLRRIDAEGGALQTICETGNGFGGAWGADGTILFAPAFGAGLMSVAASGGPPVPVTTLDATRGDASHLLPIFLPGGRRFVFVARNVDPEKTTLVAGDLDSKQTRLICRSDSAAAWSPTGHLLFAREGTLFAQRFDPNRLDLRGEVTPLVRDVRYSTDNNSGTWSASGDTLVYRLWPHDRNLVWVDRKGAVLGTLGAEADYDDVAISPDGRRVAASIRDAAHGQNLDVWVLDAERGAATRITSERSDEFHPVWHPDGETLFYASDRAGPYDIHRRPAAGGSETVVLRTKWDKIVMDASPDGQSLLFTGSPAEAAANIWILPLEGVAEPRAVVESDRFTETDGRFSPDGSSLAFTSTESGMPEVYVKSMSGGSKRLVSSGGAFSPVWRLDGRELFFITADRRLAAVPITPSPTGPVPGTPQPLFDLKAASSSAFSPEVYDVAPDGQRFLVVRQKSEETPGLVVRLHWTSLLEPK
jgi:Tol biopolymer transport system component